MNLIDKKYTVGEIYILSKSENHEYGDSTEITILRVKDQRGDNIDAHIYMSGTRANSDSVTDGDEYEYIFDTDVTMYVRPREMFHLSKFDHKRLVEFVFKDEYSLS